MVEKWKQDVLVGINGIASSTPPPTWRLHLPSQQNNNLLHQFLNFPTTTSTSTSTISARKFCAKLWQIQHIPFAKINNYGTNTLRRRRQLAQPSDTLSHKPASASSIRRHVATSLVQRHRSINRNGSALKPISPSCYSSSVQVARYKCAVTPTSSLDVKGTIEESKSRYNITTSTELLSVLNRIWSLEEQLASNISAVKALKMELGRSRMWMKELVREKKINKQEMENLMKKMTMDKFVRKNKEHDDRIKVVVQSLKEELEKEKRLRKHSESLHSKLARELSEVKSSFSGCLRNIERERKARVLLENLCDEFAKEIRDYEQEVHCLRRNSENGVKGNNSIDRLILHISEAWLDERMQMKLAQSDSDFIERISIVDKLGFDIETFLHAKRSVDLKKYGYSSPKELKEIYPCQQHSMDSFPLQDVATASALQNMAQKDSIDDDCFEPKETTIEGLRKLGSRPQGKEVVSKEINEDYDLKSNMERNMSCNDNNESCLVKKKSKGDKVHPETIKLWKSKLIALDSDKIESSTKLPKGVKENTLLAKLFEARLERQRTKSKSSKSTS